MKLRKSYDIINCTIIRDGKVESGKTIRVRKGIVAGIVNSPDEWIDLTGDGPPLGPHRQSLEDTAKDIGTADSEYDADGGWVVPGFVELHIHGCGDLSLELDTEDGSMLHKTCIALEKYGINTFVPTLQADGAAISRLGRELARSKALRDRIPGLYVEGPFVHPDKRGGILPKHIEKPDADLLKRLQDAASGTIKMMTIAPELENTDVLLREMDQLGIIPSFGHSTVSVRRARETAGGGSIHLTHLFNAMSSLSHKEPGLSALPFLYDDVTYELNGDGVHVHPDMLKMCWRHLNRENMVLISDAVVSAGKPPGEYSYFGKEVISDKEGVRYKDNGILIGSRLLIPQAARVFAGITGASITDIIPLITQNPLKPLGFNGGREIREGIPADLILIDEELRLVHNFNAYSELYAAAE